MKRNWSVLSDGARRALQVVLAGLAVYVVVQAIRGSGDGLQTDRSTSQEVQDLLWFSLLCALSTFATLEVMKRLTLFRGRFHRDLVVRWCALRLDRGTDVVREPESPEAAEYTLFRLFDDPGRSLSLLLNLPAEQLTAQVASSIEAALYGDGIPGSESDRAALARQLIAVPRSDRRGDDSDERFATAQAVRVVVDQLQIQLSESWRRFIQVAAIAVAGLYGIAFAFAQGVKGVDQPRYVIAATLVGGATSWFVRDASAIVERMRR